MPGFFDNMSNRRKDDAVITDAPAPAPPRMADLHPPFRHALEEVLRLELELSGMQYPPENGSTIVDPTERVAVEHRRRDAMYRLRAELANAKHSLNEARAVASGLVVGIVRPEIEALDNAIADRARALLAAYDVRERALTPLARDGVHIAVLAGAGLPPYAVEPVRTWLRSFERRKGKS